MHEGHRARLTNRLAKGGELYEHELLEILLFKACPRRDVNAEAHRLLDRFGSIKDVLCAPQSELVKLKGIGPSIAAYLNIIDKVIKCSSGIKSFAILNNVSEFKKFTRSRPPAGHDEIEFLFLDKDGNVRKIYTLAAKDEGRAVLTVEEAIRVISVFHAYGLFVSYKRMSGNAEPTEADDDIAKLVSKISFVCGTRMYDYCIFPPEGEPYSYFVNDRAMFELKR